MKSKLVNYIRAGYPGIAIQTTEEIRALKDIISSAREAEKKLLIWSATEGLLENPGTPQERGIDDTQELTAALNPSYERDEHVYVFRDAHTWPFDRDPILARAMKDLLAKCSRIGSCVVFLGAQFKPHPTFEKLVTVIDYTLPDKATLSLIADGIAKSTKKNIVADENVLRALSGMSTTEAENALSLSYVESKSFDAKTIYREKVQAIKRTGLLEIIEPDPRGLDAIGGLDELKAWILKRKKAYTPEAITYGLALPKGIMLIGVPGSGKSLAAKVLGTVLDVPTIKLDVGSMFNSLVGESEARMRDALALCEAVSPCILWIDEIDKGLAGASGSGAGDSGVTKRVFGTLITWQQECKRPVFIVATANNVTALPPELLRKGRFDELFALDLPSDDERKAIFSIHLVKRKRDVNAFDLPALVASTSGYTGSEIEACINEAMFHAFADNGREVTTADIVNAANVTVPLVVTAKEQIQSIRDWAKTRARFASTQVGKPSADLANRRLSNNNNGFNEV
jgi:ATP-dependent 26S proteasome regulatory subunit